MPNKYKKSSAKTATLSQLRWRVAGIAALLLVCLIIVAPAYVNAGVDWVNNKVNLGLPKLPASGFNLGLDLQGGAHLIYQADTQNVKSSERADAVEGVRDVIERRVRGGLGVAEPVVQTTRVGDDYRLIVELPGVTDVNTAIKMIGETPVLEFKEQNDEPPRDLTPEEKKQLDEFNAAAQKTIDAAAKKLAQGVDFKEVVKEYSQDEKSKVNDGNLGFITAELYPEIYNWAAGANDGQVTTKPVASFDGLNIVKRLTEKDGATEVNASHLLLCYRGAQGCDNPLYSRQEAQQRAQELKKQATPENFADLVKQYSTEPGAGEVGGDLGWFKKEQMVKEFGEAAFGASKGEIAGPVETAFGYHLIYKKDERVVKTYEVARVFVATKKAADIVPPRDEWKATGLGGKQLSRAEVVSDQSTGQVQVGLKFDAEGSDLFAALTKRNVGKPLAIFLDGTPISIPVVDEPILSGDAVIRGDFDLVEARLLSQRLNSGALPVPVTLISQRTVGATLGFESLNKSFKAGVIGLILVVIFMIGYYRFPGAVAVLGLIIYTALSLAVFKLLGVTLTLSGIAGFILSIGMAVDANVLVFERLKEELRAGRNLLSATEEAFVRAWPSIRDGNLTTLISCAVLIWLGSGFVQGFAVTLAIGVLSSMFTALTLSRQVMRWSFRWFSEYGNRLFLGHQRAPVNQNEQSLK